MKNLIYIVVLSTFFNCNYIKKKDTSKKEENIQTTSITKSIKVVSAKSGLNFRDKPKGTILGKFNLGDKVILKEKSIYDTITDGKNSIKGNWVGVENNGKIVYVFDSFLMDENKFNETKISFLVPKGYEIDYEAKGNLNGDTYEDLTLVVRDKKTAIGKRTVLVFLGNPNFYTLYKKSTKVFPDKFHSIGDGDYSKIYTLEGIEIIKGKLVISLYGEGVVGNSESEFTYKNNELLLSKVKHHAIGAGSWSTITYDFFKGELLTEVVNTLKEDMPTETKISKFPIKKYRFEYCVPEDVTANLMNN